MSEERMSVALRWKILSILVIIILSFSCTGYAREARPTPFEYKVQEDPYFTFAYPAEMTISSTPEQSHNAYHITDNKEDPITYLIKSADNSEGKPLGESALADVEKAILATLIDKDAKKDLEVGKPQYISDTNVSFYFVSYLDPVYNTIISDLVVSTDKSIITGVLTEPATISDPEYRNFILKSLLSITPRDARKGFTLIRVGTDRSIGEKIAVHANQSSDKNHKNDPYQNYFSDPTTMYIYLPDYGFFYDYLTGDYYYPDEFGKYDQEYFIDYLGATGDNTDAHYSYLFNHYPGKEGYTCTGSCPPWADQYQGNEYWDDYIRQ